MSRLQLVPVNLQSRTTNPTTPTLRAGDMYWNSTAGEIRVYNGTAWVVADFAANTVTLTNKTINLTSNTLSGTLAQFNTACSDADFASLAGSETLSNKTLASPVVTTAITLNATGELRLADTDSSNYVGFKSPGTVAANRIWTLPAADGTNGQVLSTNGAGTLQFTSGAGTVTSITAGTGLSGGTITTSGTIALSTPVAVANGGTGVTTSTGTGNNVLSADPTLSGTVTFSGQISMTAVGAVGNMKDFQTLQIMNGI